jgi:hypothetical protein
MSRSPFQFDSIFGLLLLISGLAVFIIGLREGYQGFDDPYPGYGERWRDCEKAKRGANRLRDRRRVTLNTVKGKIAEFFESTRRSLHNAILLHDHFNDEIARAIDLVRKEDNNAIAFQERISGNARYLIQVYREENAKFRRSPKKREKYGLTPAPPHFINGQVELPNLIPSLTTCITRAERALDIIAGNIAAIQRVQKWLEDAAKVALARVERIAQEDADRPPPTPEVPRLPAPRAT